MAIASTPDHLLQRGLLCRTASYMISCGYMDFNRRIRMPPLPHKRPVISGLAICFPDGYTFTIGPLTVLPSVRDAGKKKAGDRRCFVCCMDHRMHVKENESR